MSKKILTTILALSLAATALASCTSVEVETEDTTEEATEEITEEATEEATDAPAAEVSLTDIRDAVAAAFGDEYICNMPIPDAETLEMMYQISPDLYTDFVADTPMIMTHIDTFLAFKPAEGKTADLVAALETYNEGQQMFQYPMNVAKAEAAVIYEKGGYVFFIRLGMLPEMDDAAYETMTPEEIDASRLEAAKANNQKAIDAIDAILG